MPPKKDSAGGDAALNGFDVKETRILAGAFVASIGVGKIDYDLFEKLTGNTAGTLKKMWPPVKRKAAELHPSFAPMAGIAEGDSSKAAPTKATPTKKAPTKKASTKETPTKAIGGKKRKAAEEEVDDDDEKNSDDDPVTPDEEEKPKKRGRGRPKKAKTEKKSKATTESSDDAENNGDVEEEADA